MLTDGTDLDGTVKLTLQVVEPNTEGLNLPMYSWSWRGVMVAHNERHAVPPTVAGVTAALAECLPWFETVDSRAVIVSGWVRDPRWQPPGPLWEKIDVAARWGMRDEASALLRYGRRKEWQHRPKFAAMAEKHQLPF